MPSMHEDESDDEVIGPMPATDTASDADTPVSEAVRAFAEREQRQREMAEQERRSKDTAASARPDWMLTMPSMNEARPMGGGPLRARGFQQNTGRAQHVSGESASEAQRLWTETPAQRLERLQKGVGGSGIDTPEDRASRQERERAAARDAAIREKVQALNADRQQSLLEQYQSRRRDELKRHTSTSSPSHDRDPDEDRSHRRRHHEHHRHSSSDRSRGHDEDRSRHRHHRSHRRRDEDSDERHSRHRSRHRDRDRTSSRSRSRSPPRKTRAQREEEDRQAHGEYAPLLFDKDKVLGAGSRLMDERTRSRSIKDATQLSTRFSTGHSGSFL